MRLNTPESVLRGNRRALIVALLAAALCLVALNLPIWEFSATVFSKKSGNTFVGDEKYQAVRAEVEAAAATGADTYLSGRLSYESVNMAASLGINLIEAGHFYTEALLPRYWAEELLPALSVPATYYHSCSVKIVGQDK
jgi:hypothetical protein